MQLDLLTSFPEDSPVRTLVAQDKGPGLMAKEAVYGEKSSVSLAKFDPDTSSWRTPQRCLLEGWEQFSQSWPRSGMMQNGIAYRLPPLVPNISATGFGLLPTLTKSWNNSHEGINRQGKKTSRMGLGTVLSRLFPTLTHYGSRGGATPERTRRMMTKSGRGCDLNSELRHAYPETTGIINPYWAEGFMGFPTGWTELPPSETPSFRKSPK